MYQIYRFSSLWAICVVLMVANVLSAMAATVSSMIEVESHAHPAPVTINITDLLHHKSRSLMKPFEKVINKLTKQELLTCDVETIFRFVSVSQSFEARAVQDAETSVTLEAIRSLYGIRKAICEAGVSGTPVPSSCQKLLATQTSTSSPKQMIRSEVELATSDAAVDCLRQFQKHHFFWTSYSNNRQDADSIFDMVRSDLEMQQIIMTYREHMKSMENLNDELEIMRAAAAGWHEDLALRSRSFFDMQDLAFIKLELEFENVSAAATDKLEQFLSKVDQLGSALDKQFLTAVEDLSNIEKVISLLRNSITTVQDEIWQQHSHAASELGMATQSQVATLLDQFEMLKMQASFLSTILKNVENSSSRVQHYSERLDLIHAANVDQIQEEYDLSRTVLDMQRQSIAQAALINERIDSLLNVTEKLRDTLGIFSYLLDFVQRHEAIATTMGRYTAISTILARFENVLISPATVKSIRAGLLVVETSVLLKRKLDLPNSLPDIKRWLFNLADDMETLQWVVWALVIFVLTVLVAVIVTCSNKRSKCSWNYDVERATNEPRTKIRMCDRQRRRLKPIARHARHETAPPGL